jgi:hypothetical protein
MSVDQANIRMLRALSYSMQRQSEQSPKDKESLIVFHVLSRLTWALQSAADDLQSAQDRANSGK